MRFLFIAATIVALSLIACNGPGESATRTGPESTLTETPEPTKSSPSAAPPTPEGPENTPAATPEPTKPPPSATPPTPPSPENTLIETPEYTGVLVSESGASEFSYLFDQASTSFWQPSVDDVSKAEECIRQFLVSLQDEAKLDTYQQESVAFILENLETYRRQYVGIVVDGEKRIWCNAFFSADSFPNWERVPVDVDGGGRHFWQIEYDLLKDECINFYVHGES